MRRALVASLVVFALLAPRAVLAEGSEPVFYRGINFNGPPVIIDGRQWQGGDAPDFECRDSAFENQDVKLSPAADGDLARMIRSSVWSPQGQNRLLIRAVPAGRYRVFLYVWEDNDSQTFDVLLEGKVVRAAVESGSAGQWQKLGPWNVDIADGTIELGSRGGHANFSGVEIWRVAGDPPAASADPASTSDPFFVTSDRRAGYDWWSLAPIQRPKVPEVRRADWPINPVDRFVLARLEQAELVPSPAADRATLIRRVFFDLVGLPPSPEEVDGFVNDPSPAASAVLVDRLLASPHYGERWARHWLDVVRFGESQGFERNKLRPGAWRYRDGVVEALNRDMPYDEFVRLQLAGDVLRPDDPLAVIASGFLVMGPYDLTAYTDGTASMRAAAREEEIEGLVGTVGQTFLGLSLNCARCHDHKFDPIRQKEYYQVAAALGGTYHGDERESLSSPGRAAARAQLEKISGEVALLREQLAGETAPWRRAEIELEISRLCNLAELLGGGPAHVSVPKEPGVVHVLARGDFRQKGEPVAPSGVDAIRGPAQDWKLASDAPEAARRVALADWITDPLNPLTARVIANRVWAYHFGAGLVATPNDFGFNGGKPSHPELLDWLARELLAPESGPRWSLKRLHRVILLSATYQQASAAVPEAARSAPRSQAPPGNELPLRLRLNTGRRDSDGNRQSLSAARSQAPPGNEALPHQQASSAVEEAMKKDADNRLLWRHTPLRLEAETLRDAVLAISGELNPAMGGPGFRDFTTRQAGAQNQIHEVFDAVGPQFNRRSLYRTWIRTGTNPFLDVLDCPDPSVATPRRNVTTTPLQALALLNNPFMERSARAWAARLARKLPGDAPAQVRRAYREAFARPPDAEEERFALEFVNQHGLEQFCLVLFNANEFLYVE